MLLESLRAEGGKGGIQNVFDCNSGQMGIDNDGKHNSTFVYGETRGHKEFTASTGGNRDLLICQSQFTGPVCIVSTGPSEHPGRLAELEVLKPHRMDAEPNIPKQRYSPSGRSPTYI